MLHQQVVPRHSLELLKRISPVLSEGGFYLAGGTALALRLEHRISIFFIQEGLTVACYLRSSLTRAVKHQ